MGCRFSEKRVSNSMFRKTLARFGAYLRKPFPLTDVLFSVSYNLTLSEVNGFTKSGSSKASNLMGSTFSRGGDYETIY